MQRQIMNIKKVDEKIWADQKDRKSRWPGEDCFETANYYKDDKVWNLKTAWANVTLEIKTA